MTIQSYLQETGTGPSAHLFVPDLVGRQGASVDLVLLLESPHIDEVQAKHPLAGRAGREALAFLSETRDSGRSLGEEISQRQRNGDFRVAILNVSRVPLQPQAVTGSDPLRAEDWAQLERLRGSGAKQVGRLRTRRQYAESLLDNLASRLALLDLGPGTTVAPTGRFAQMFWRSLPATPSALLEVPHPARHQWARAGEDAAEALDVLRDRYVAAS